MLKVLLKLPKLKTYSTKHSPDVVLVNSPYASSYLVRGKYGWVMIDCDLPGCSKYIIKYINSLGISHTDIKFILLTHGHIDHAGSAAEMRKLSGAPIAMSSLDRDLVKTLNCVPKISGLFSKSRQILLKSVISYLPKPTFLPDISLENEHNLLRFGLEGAIIETPGHTNGSLTIVLDNGNAFVGDLFSKFKNKIVPNNFADDQKKIAVSMNKLSVLKNYVFFPGHGNPILYKEICFDEQSKS